MLMTIIEVALCASLFLIAKWRMNNSKPAMQWFDANDPSIRKPFVIPTFSLERITYGSLLVPYIPMLVIYLYNPDLIDARVPLRYLFGWSVAGFVCYIFKGWIGRLRPNFMVLNGDSSIDGHNIYQRILEKNPSSKQLFITESRKSFYSGHATVGAFAGAFTCILLHSICPYSAIPLSLLKVAVFVAGLYPGITQGICYFHHWSDVITGQLAGVFFAYFSFYYVK